MPVAGGEIGVIELREMVDEFATRLILTGVTSELVADMGRFSEQARESGFADTVGIAAELIEAMNDVPPGSEVDAGIVREFSRLQASLSNESAAPREPELQKQTKQEQTKPEQAKPAATFSLMQDPQLVGDFILESREHLASIESQMLVLEQNAADTSAIHPVFRGFHTIKGLAGFLEFAEIQAVAHEVETLLDLARDSKLAITPAIVDVVLESADYLKQSLNCVEEALAQKTSAVFGANRTLLSRVRAAMTQSPAEAATAAPDISAAIEPATAASAKESKPKAGDSFSVRVDTGKLDHLMDMVGEMVIAQSLIRHNQTLTAAQDARLQRDLSQLARITNEVQRTTMSMRMLPIGQLFQRTARLVRDLSRRAGKQVELETSGEETELDKTIAEQLADPLMHMVRNALDHGIERPDDRVAAGKNPTARVRLAAYHQGGQIVVEIADDGRGLNREKILAKALQNGLIQEGAQLSENEIFQLIFEPGFSTAEKVTDISGRGVGMDVVRGHVQKLRGRIEIQSKPGEGTTFYLKLPLTLAIIEGLVVLVGANRYIVPIFAVKEMFRPTPEALSTICGRDEMALVRGSLLPIVRLHRRFDVQPRSEKLCAGLLVVAECQGRQFCLFVDELAGKQEVVIKSLGESLKNVAGVAGGAILGDGRVGLILDMDGVLQGTTHE